VAEKGFFLIEKDSCIARTGRTMNDKIEQIWERTRALRPTIEAHRSEGDGLHHLPDAIARAFVDANVYRLLLPHEFGGEDVDPLIYYDLVEEVSLYDGSAGWNYSIGSSTPVILGDLSPTRLGAIFASADSCIAASASPPGRAVEVEGGYRVTGRFAWASGIHQARWVVANCFIFDGDQMRKSAAGIPVALGLVMPKQDCNVLDTWHVLGMRGTGSTEFAVDGAFVPKDMAIRFFGADSQYPYPIFHLPPTYFGYNHVSVMNGIARSALNGLKALANAKTSAMTRTDLRDEPQAQYAVAKAEAMIEANGLAVKESFRALWTKVVAGESVPLTTRARLRRNVAHAAECAIEAVELCYRAAGGTAIYESAPFERALRDVNAAATHITTRRVMMEEAGRVAFGLPPRTPLF
jgi:alkylation response protein AidB-like acyl-CoA dehydrogenase